MNSFFWSEEASSAVEYVVILSLIVAVCLVAVMAVGEAAYGALWDAVEALE